MLKRTGKVLEVAADQLGRQVYARLLSKRAELQLWPMVADYEGKYLKPYHNRHGLGASV